MPIEIVNSVAAKCRANKLPKWMKDLREKKNLSCTELGEAVAAMVENRKKSESAQAGDADEPIYYGEACYTQVAEAGSVDGSWIKLMDPDTKIKAKNGKFYLIDEIAHVAALNKWREQKDKIKGHLNHDYSKAVDLGLQDFRYDFGDGLHAYLNPPDPEIRKAVESGYMKPSIEVKYYLSDVEDDKFLAYNPIGVGLMFDQGRAMGATVGPSVPDLDNSIAHGGTEVTEEENNTNNQTTEENSNQNTAVEGNNTNNQTTEGNNQTEDALSKMQKEIEALKTERETLNKKLMELEPEKAKKVEYENALKQTIVEKMPEGYNAEGKTLERIKEDYDLLMAANTMYTKGIPKLNIPPLAPQKPVEQTFTQDGYLTDDAYKKIKDQMMGASGKKDRKEAPKFDFKTRGK